MDRAWCWNIQHFFRGQLNSLKHNKQDKRDILKDEHPFSYRIIKDNKAQIFYNTTLISVLSGKQFFKLQTVIQRNDPYKLQLFLAKITGQFKRGNEKLNMNKFYEK